MEGSFKSLGAILMEDIEQFTFAHPQDATYADIDEMTYGYLYEWGAGERIWGLHPERAAKPPFTWPEDHVRYVMRSFP